MILAGRGAQSGVISPTINLGKGKRMLVKDGHLDPKYLITVPFQRRDQERTPT